MKFLRPREFSQNWITAIILVLIWSRAKLKSHDALKKHVKYMRKGRKTFPACETGPVC